MKPFVFSLFFFFPELLYAQHISGKVVDKETGLPVVYATVSISNVNVITSYSGRFTLNNPGKEDTLLIKCIGYRSYKIAVKDIRTDTLSIYLHQASIMLRNVNINARRNYKQDSVNLREQYSSVFNYKGPVFKDMFITVDPYGHAVNTYNTSQNNATMLVNVNLLSVIGLLTKKKDVKTKLQQMLLQDEANNYVDHRFSKEKIIKVTGLGGDSLTNFIMMYRPTIDTVQKMNDYQMMLYIKRNYIKFIKHYTPKSRFLINESDEFHMCHGNPQTRDMEISMCTSLLSID